MVGLPSVVWISILKFSSICKSILVENYSIQNQIDQQSKLQELDIFLKERLEESNIIMDNLAKTSKSSSQKDDPHESQEDYVISELINGDTVVFLQNEYSNNE